jgi:uncharacterized protein
MHISALYCYPIKSCAAVPLLEARIDACGIRHDRRLLLTDADGVFLTQREHPRLALIKPEIDGDHLTVVAPEMPTLTLAIVQTGVPHAVRIWRDTCQAIDQGDVAADWFGAFLHTRCRLVAMAPNFVRRVNPQYARRAEDQVGFADGYPFLLTTEASLQDLNARLAAPLPMNRFRPNIVIAGSTPYAEDRWQSLRLGPVDFAVAKPCVRCVITTTDQETTQKGQEPLRTLATYRHVSGLGVTFGQNLIHLEPGTLRLGDPVVLVENAPTV